MPSKQAALLAFLTSLFRLFATRADATILSSRVRSSNLPSPRFRLSIERGR